MKTHLTNTAGKIISGLTVLALLGTLGGCGEKTDGAQNQAASNVTAGATVAPGNDSGAATDNIGTDNQAADMKEHHRQDMDHSDMRRGGPMMPNDAPPTSTPDNSQSAPMSDM